jgi:hypothetical protein
VEERGKAVRGLQRAAASSWHVVGDNDADVEGWFRFPFQVVGGGGMLCRVVCVCYFALFVWLISH